MERPAKERLIGAVVIVTVAWLLIPVFLDQRGADDGATVARQLALPEPGRGDGTGIRRETVTLDAPDTPAPTTSAEPVVTALPVPEQREAPSTRAGTPTGSTVPSAGESSAGAATPAAAGPAEPDDDDGSQAEQSVTAAPVAETPAPAAAGGQDREASTDADAGAPPPGDGQLWAVQLGSFSDRDNAQRLAGELREQGLPAFLSEVDAGGRTLHRVRVGPQASRDAAETIAERLVAAGQTARVVRHP